MPNKNRRLPQSAIKPLREKLKSQQKNLCPITGNPLGDDIVLDHCHKTGYIRATLPRWVNATLGRVENWANRVGNGVDPVAFLRGCADYVEFHRKYPSGLLHPTYKTEEEKRLLRNKRARQARAKKKLTQ